MSGERYATAIWKCVMDVAGVIRVRRSRGKSRWGQEIFSKDMKEEVGRLYFEDVAFLH